MMRICRRSTKSLYQIDGDIAIGVQTSKILCWVVGEGLPYSVQKEPFLAQVSCRAHRAGGDYIFIFNHGW